jgi:V/A-type H+-transporting ATPase subunit E
MIMASSEKISSGVQQLIDRLHNEGVDAGKKMGQQLVKEAERRAAQILSDARKEAGDILAGARADIEREKEAAKESLRMAARDTVLTMRSEIATRFEAQIRRLVTEELEDREFLRRLILEVAGKSTSELKPDQAMDILVSERAGVDQLVREIAAEMLREGVQIKPADDDRSGIRVRLKGEDVELDMTEEVISEALIRHLLPRFRYITQGIQESD